MAGDVLRVVVDGCPRLDGRNPAEILDELRSRHDDFRRFLIQPPRDHGGVNACLLLPPSSREAAGTLVAATQFGYAPLAGTLLMASGAVLVASGRAADRAETPMVFDTAAGPNEVRIGTAAGGAFAGRWITRPPRTIAVDHVLGIDAGTSLRVSLIDSGLTYVVAPATELGVELDDTERLAPLGSALCRAAARQAPSGDAGTGHLAMIVGPIEPGDHSRASRARVVWVSPGGTIAPSPGGTGALAAAAHFLARGDLMPDAPFEAAAPGGSFHCRVGDDRASIEATVDIIARIEFPWRCAGDIS